MWFWCIICIASRCSIHIMIIMCMYVCIYIYINLWIYSSTATGCHDHPSGIWEMVLCLMLSSWYTYLDAAFSNIHLQAFCSGAYFQRSMKLWKAEKPLKNKKGENTTNKINKGTDHQIIRSKDGSNFYWWVPHLRPIAAAWKATSEVSFGAECSGDQKGNREVHGIPLCRLEN